VNKFDYLKELWRHEGMAVKQSIRSSWYVTAVMTLLLTFIARAQEVNSWKPSAVQGEGGGELKVKGAATTVVKLYRDGKYLECIKLAIPLVEKRQEDSLTKDVVMFHLGASYYHVGDFKKAIIVFQRHIASYGVYAENKSAYATDAEYMLASAYAHGGFHTRAEDALRIFLESYKEGGSKYIPLAIYDRAYIRVKTGKVEDAVKFLQQLLEDYKQSSVLPIAVTLYGKIHQDAKEVDQAEIYYRRALKESRKRNDNRAEKVALASLVSLYSGITKPDRARIMKFAKDYDDYFSKFLNADSSFKVAADGVAILRDAGRGKEAVDSLLNVVMKGKVCSNEGHLAKYLRIWIREHCMQTGCDVLGASDMLAQVLKNSSRPSVYRVIANSIVIDQVYEELTKRELSPDKEKAVRELAANQMNQLWKTDRTGLSPRALVVCGSILCELPQESGKPFPKIGYHIMEDTLSMLGKELDDEGVVLAGTARTGIVNLAVKRPDDKQVIEKASEIVDEALKNPKETEEYKWALGAKFEILHHTGQHKKAVEMKKSLLALPMYLNDPKITFLLGISYRRLGKPEEAITQLEPLLGPYKRALKYSAPACKEVMEMIWKRNKMKDGKKDRQEAYERGRFFYSSLQGSVEANSRSIPIQQKKAFEDVKRLYLQYIASGEVKP